MTEFLSRVEEFLKSRGESPEIQQLTPDASTREYFRIGWRGKTAIACVYPEPFKAAENSYLDVTNLFLKSDLPVAEVYESDEALGLIVLEDLGDRILRDELNASTPERREALLNSAIDLIPRIQAATTVAFETGSVASKLKFDVEKLLWELEFFNTHYFITLNKRELPGWIASDLTREFRELSAELESRATVLCHRDYHAANLMLDPTGRLRIIDHQDARIGSEAYDLVSLLLDRVTEPPTAEWLGAKRRYFLDKRLELGLPEQDEDQFAAEFRLQTVQRCLKAVGTFSFQSANRGKTYFLPFIRPMFEIVERALEKLDRFPAIRQLVEGELDES